jgi:hypothetical protein
MLKNETNQDSGPSLVTYCLVSENFYRLQTLLPIYKDGMKMALLNLVNIKGNDNDKASIQPRAESRASTQ